MPNNDSIDDDLNPGSYGFADPPPAKREAPPTKTDRYMRGDDDDDDEAPRHRGRRDDREFDDDDDDDRMWERRERDPQRRADADKDPLDSLSKPRPWWFWSVVLLAIGLAGFVLLAVVAAAQMGPTAGLMAFGIALVCVAVETVFVTIALIGIGHVFGIDYGPAMQAIPKLFCCITFENGFVFALGLTCVSIFGPLGSLMAMSCITLITYAVFQQQFHLNIFETLLTVFLIQACAWAVGTGLGMIVLRELMAR